MSTCLYKMFPSCPRNALFTCFKCLKFLHIPHCRLLIVLILLTCLLPFFVIKLPYSPMYDKPVDVVDLANELNKARLEKARAYFSRFKPDESMLFYSDRYKKDVELVVCIVTVNRRLRNTGYLPQTAAVIDSIMKTDQYFKNSVLVLCNVDRDPHTHSDANLVKRYIPYVNKNGNNSLGRTFDVHDYTSQHSDENRGREIGDYVYCLNVSKSFHSPYILMLEDDVVPYQNIFQVLQYTINQHLLHSSHSESLLTRNRQFAFLKLYYPERWLGFANEPDRIVELVSIGLVGGGIMLFLISTRAHMKGTTLHYCVKLFYYCFGTVFTILIVSLTGRQYVMDLRRISPQLFKFSPTPACCTPAMFYSTHIIPSLIDHLVHNSYMNKDLVINDFIEKNHIPGYILEPNLVRHIGMYTSLKNAYKPPEEFLFQLHIP